MRTWWGKKDKDEKDYLTQMAMVCIPSLFLLGSFVLAALGVIK